MIGARLAGMKDGKKPMTTPQARFLERFDCDEQSKMVWMGEDETGHWGCSGHISITTMVQMEPATACPDLCTEDRLTDVHKVLCSAGDLLVKDIRITI